MKNKLAFTLIITFICLGTAFGQYENNWAVGLKVGEPLGLNIRKYFSYGDRVFDVNVGAYGLLIGGTRYYYNKDKENSRPIYDQAGVMFQGIYQFHRGIGKSEKIHVYYGFGGQINSRRRPDKLGQPESSFMAISLGPAVNSGIELKLPENDMAVFLDAGGYVEIAPKPFFLAPTLNIGLRVNIIK